jgi:hypothetical protein
MALFISICVAVVSPTLRGDDSQADQINAAAAQAFDTLQREVLGARLTNEMTVGAFVEHCHARDALDATLHGAEQIGGTRWLDDQTVQVRLEIRGADLARTIEKIAEDNSASLPAPLHTLRERLKKDFSHRIFSATATSTAAGAADRLCPDASQIAWRAVTDGDRRAAIEAARHNAIERVIDSLRAVAWDNGKRHLADALAAGAVSDSLRDWLSGRPIISMEFRDDLEVRISLAASPADLWPALSGALGKQSAVSVPRDAREWDALRHQVKMKMAAAIGAAPAHASAPGVGAGAPLRIISREPPAWASTSADAEGVSTSIGGNKLRTARVAENIAMARLRARVDALSLDSEATLGQAARRDPQIAEALARGIGRARISKVDYDSPEPGAVRVRMTLDLESIWRELAR